MKLDIRPDMQISEVQRKFNSQFPYLKLEFYKNRRDMSAGRLMNRSKQIGEAEEVITDSYLEIEPGMTVKELESNLAKIFTLSVQVFRKSGNTWLQTTMTDNWTLQRQNEHGKEISESEGDKNREPGDFDLERDVLD
jgi:hypothetical protein